VLRAVTAAAVAGLACLAAAGCDGDGGQKPRPISGPAKEAAAVVQRLQRATADRDFRTICRELFSRRVREQAGGRGCPRFVKRSAGDVRNPRIEIERITIRRDTASVRVVTRATGQAPAKETIELVRERGRFRISSLGG
jgi:hypothetical protein